MTYKKENTVINQVPSLLKVVNIFLLLFKGQKSLNYKHLKIKEKKAGKKPSHRIL